VPSHRNPIEEAFSKIKNLLRTAQARSREALVEAMGKALERSPPGM
jgi:transposase